MVVSLKYNLSIILLYVHEFSSAYSNLCKLTPWWSIILVQHSNKTGICCSRWCELSDAQISRNSHQPLEQLQQWCGCITVGSIGAEDNDRNQRSSYCWRLINDMINFVPRQFVYEHFVYDTSSTNISSTTVYQRVGQLYIQLLLQQIIIFINSNYYLHYDFFLSIPLPLTLW